MFSTREQARSYRTYTERKQRLTAKRAALDRDMTAVFLLTHEAVEGLLAIATPVEATPSDLSKSSQELFPASSDLLQL